MPELLPAHELPPLSVEGLIAPAVLKLVLEEPQLLEEGVIFDLELGAAIIEARQVLTTDDVASLLASDLLINHVRFCGLFFDGCERHNL